MDEYVLFLQMFAAHFLQQIALDGVELVGEIHIDLVRVYKAAGLIPQGLLLGFADIADFHNGGGSVAGLSFTYDLDQKLPEPVGAAFELRFFPGFYRVEDNHVFAFVKGLVGQADRIGADLIGFLIVNAEYGFVSVVSSKYSSKSRLYRSHIARAVSFSTLLPLRRKP